MDVVEQVRQLVAAFDEFVADVAVDEVIGRGEGAVSAAEPARHHSQVEALDKGSPGRRLGLVAAAVLLVGGLLGALVWIDRGGSSPTDSTTPTADAEESPGTTSSSAASPVAVVSPLVEMQSLLTNQANTELFVVQADTGSYWRLSTLARFDGTTWGFPESALSRADGELTAVPDGDDELRQEIRIVNLGDKLVPAAADPVAASPAEGLRWNADASTLVKIDGDLVEGDVYEIVSVPPHFETEDLQAATSTAPGDAIYLELPNEFPARAGDLARDVTADATSPFETALALQNWFRSQFNYGLDVEAGHSNSAMERFLDERVGYSEQFAATYAAMMRSLGIPTRVAVGFTPGIDPGGQGYSVLGKNAHAWPEVWFDGLGWVLFEPTPGRGAPGAENYTNVGVSQNE